MDFNITIKNYRCFTDSRPARFELRKGFTAFLGVNNSGKSSLLKFFYEFRSLFGSLSFPSGNLIAALGENHQAFGMPNTISDLEEFFCRMNQRGIEIHFEFPEKPIQTAAPIPHRVEIVIPRAQNTFIVKVRGPAVPVDRGGHSFHGNVLHDRHGNALADFSLLFTVCKELSETLYIGPFRNAINIGTREDYFDIQVGESFIKQWRTYLTGTNIKFNEAAYQLTENIRRIFEYKDLRINPAADEKTLQVFVNGRSYRLTELGSGLTQFILVLANAAVKRPCYILIDEPELNLHPSLQLDFLTTLASYASIGILFSTHSFGLARASAYRLYSIRKIAEGDSEITAYESTPRLSEFLGELSFSGYRELGFDKVLLVEGATDVTTIQPLLRMYGKDHKIVVLHLGGGALINAASAPQLIEIKRISDNVSALIDSERSSASSDLEPNRVAFKNECEQAGINCKILERRAIENYLSDRAIKMIKGESYRALGYYERLREAPNAWAKEENWRIAREMTREEVGASDLGEFLDAL